jgi:ATP dependent DNA ligase domain
MDTLGELGTLYLLPLYKPGAKPNLKRSVWRTYCENNVLCTEHGKEDGKMQTSRRTIAPLKSGKSAEEHALDECKRGWLKKLDVGYLPDEATNEFEELLQAKLSSGGNNRGLIGVTSTKKKPIKKPTARAVTADVVYLPNLAKEYEFTKACRAYFDYSIGVYVQPKLDGNRALAYVSGGEVFLMSRKGKQWMWLDQIRRQILELLECYAIQSERKIEEVVLDGELYLHTLPLEITGPKFNFISSVCKTSRSKASEHEHLMQYHIFDLLVPEQPDLEQSERRELLEQLWGVKEDTDTPDLVLVRTEVVYSEEGMKEYYSQFIEEEYEGIILRDRSLVYQQGKRQSELRKYKSFQDDEFEIVDALQAEGTQAGCVIWVCKTMNGDDPTSRLPSREVDTFTTTIRGELEYRQQLYRDRDQYIGRLLTVRHQTPRDEIEAGTPPRFPVGIAIREDM